ncbi:hypothetical protein GF366_04280 [Candidatus Peregrinibacteria bacterium]|nr:hypothetical protein [Candidatus Peregrinibacteria bacterium]
MKKTVTFLLSLAAFSLVFAGCAAEEETSTEPEDEMSATINVIEDNAENMTAKINVVP